MDFDFDHAPDRRGSGSVKYDARGAVFGNPDVVPMWVADMDFATAPCVAAAIGARAAHPIYGYTEIPESLYESLVSWHHERHGWRIKRDWIVLTPGTLPALAAAVCALTEVGDGVVIQPPVYGHFASLIGDAKRVALANPLREHDGRYDIDLDDLERQAASGARLLLLCNPHNPVGRVWHRDTLETIAALARRYRMTVLSDDIHGDLAYRDTEFVPIGSLAGEGDPIISALSPNKTFNIQGLALSALIVPDAGQRAALRGELSARCLDNFNPFSLVAAAAAWRDGGPWRDALVAYLEGNRDAVVEVVRDRLAPIRCHAPEAGYLVWLDCRGLGLDDDALARFLIDDCGLGLNPGRDYGAGGSGYMRLNIGAPRARLLAALESIRKALAHRSTTP